MSSKPDMVSRYDDLRKSFQDHASSVRALQRRASEEIVPDVQVHEDLDDDEIDWVEEYLKDGATVYRIYKRQKFITSFTHESLRKSVLWRLEHLKPVLLSQQRRKSLQNASVSPPSIPATAIHFLDRSIRDVLGRPIAILRVSQLNFKSGLENLKRDIVLSLEWMRIVLQQINSRESKGPSWEPVLQYVVAVDVKDVSISTIPVELVSWYLKEVQPWYNGVVGSALIVNYSWAHSGLWRILKLLLPASMISKVGFPSNDELAELLPESCINIIFNPTQAKPSTSHNASASSSLPTPPSTRSPSPVQMKRSRSRITSDPEPSYQVTQQAPARSESTSRFSAQNPFFGYPIITEAMYNIPSRIRASFSDSLSSLPSYIQFPGSTTVTQQSPPPTSSVPALRHGRRRKRDLARTLLIMYWQRWKDRAIVFTVLVLVFNLAVLRALRGSRHPFARNVQVWVASHKLLTRSLTAIGAGTVAAMVAN
ncbi:hypothetical protein SCHPADRAFT_926823 [Schizopora paradoxa]|uniref:CRAL-TRIO domain-containing protein n=1 Tax=Schizopora paradoxa TaxID=27342 RepID=A0A0H2RW62_9AGAM|nr:hypothetical protein SCHPADRAFT_926823 [Schizopora paradoxa]